MKLIGLEQMIIYCPTIVSSGMEANAKRKD